MLHINTDSVADVLLSELIDCLVNNYECFKLNHNNLKSTISTILNNYEIHIKQHTNNSNNIDLKYKISMFLSAKKLEGLSKNTLNSYAIELRVFSDYMKKLISDIKPVDIRQYLSQFNNLKTASLSTKLSILKSFFGWLNEEEIILVNPTKKIKLPKEERRIPKALSVEELEMMRESCKTIRQRALLEVLYATGCRVSEIINMNKDDIDYNESAARVIGKGNKERNVYFSFKAIHYIKKYILSRCDNNPALFVGERKPYNRLQVRAIQREIDKIAKQANINKSISPHTLRHTFATLTLNNGADIATIQSILGHTDPKTTQLYSRVSDEHIKYQYRKHLVL